MAEAPDGQPQRVVRQSHCSTGAQSSSGSDFDAERGSLSERIVLAAKLLAKLARRLSGPRTQTRTTDAAATPCRLPNF